MPQTTPHFTPDGWWIHALRAWTDANGVHHAANSPNFGFPTRGDHGNKGRRAVVLHVTDGVDSRSWLCSPTSKVSAHFLIREEGVYQLVRIHDSTWANGIWEPGHAWRGVPDSQNPNEYTISIEREGRPNTPLSQAQEAATTTLLQALAEQYPQFAPYVPHQNLIGHYEISPAHRPNCPGRLVDFDRIANAANSALPGPVFPSDPPLLGPPSCAPVQALALLAARPHPGYGSQALNEIVTAYWTACTAVGVDPCLAIAQMGHETNWLNSFWAERPRRNPAGIGVTGDTRPGVPNRKPAGSWAWNGREWEAGISFPSWAPQPGMGTSSIAAHVGRLLRYAVQPGGETPAQKDLIGEALAVRPLDRQYWGCAPTLTGLEGTWAVPGDGYADRITQIMQALRAVPV